MVLTFLNNLRGVGQAVFTIEDDRLTVPIDRSQFSRRTGVTGRLREHARQC